MYEYRARCLHVIDGDTFDVVVDLGMRIMLTERIRLFGVDTPERGHADWAAARSFTAQFLYDSPSEWPLLIRTIKPKDKYGRWLAQVFQGDQSLAKALTSRKLAVDYFGGKR
jgi:micrococcal nuclease